MCKWCLKAKELAEDYNLKYEWIDLDEDQNLNEFKLNFPDAKTIPQITWYGNYIGGYEELVKEVENTGSYGQGKI